MEEYHKFVIRGVMGLELGFIKSWVLMGGGRDSEHVGAAELLEDHCVDKVLGMRRWYIVCM